MSGGVAVVGVFVADLAFSAARLPAMGETVLGDGFRLGPGGKGSNQAIAARRAGAEVTFISRLADDAFGALARQTYAAEGIAADHLTDVPGSYTGAAFILVEPQSGENAIVIAPGAAATLDAAAIERAAPALRAAKVVATNLEVPVAAARRALEIGRQAGAATLLNPAPALPLDDDVYPLVDYLTPNESEAAALSSLSVTTPDDAARAAAWFRERGVGTALITLGARGVWFDDGTTVELVPAFDAGRVVDTTGAGDAFNGGFAAALAAGQGALAAVRFGCATAAIAVTRQGTAPAMPRRDEVLRLLERGR